MIPHPDAPLCAAPDPHPRPPRFELPALACDAHAHICGPAQRYPYSPQRIYTPPDALLPEYRHMLKTLGLARAVLVQPSVYGTDNTALIDALATDQVNLRGVAVIDPAMPAAELERLHAAGIRGVRCNIVDIKTGKGELPMLLLGALADKIRPLGWHIELLMHVNETPELDRLLDTLRVPVVFGHLGYMQTTRGLDDPGFKALLRLMREGRGWAKLSGPYRISDGTARYADVAPYAHALLDANAGRVVWGSDWPHVMTKGVMPNDGELCDLLADWIPDVAQRHAVLVDNPACLYGF